MSTSVSNDDSCSYKEWKLTTNWAIAAGSLSSTVTVESSADCETLDDSDASKPQSPLLLVSSSPDSDPCEIKIIFTQKQEVRQVYVRSTARVYEIYSAHSLGSGNDYLGTVRCGIAIRGDEVLHATDVEPVAPHPKESSGEQEKVSSGGSEDDWVDVRVLDTSLQDDRLNVVRERNGTKQRTNLQDHLYEATAEFNDSDACTSLTLRLLSLQTKDNINIDEIYIFSNPAESADSDAQAAPVDNSATTSLMSMLVPTLLQLSKSSSAQKQDLHASNSSVKVENLDVGSKVNHASDVENEIEQKIDKAVSKAPEVHIPDQESDTVQRYNVVAQTNVLNNRVESILEQLVSRVSRIEDICLRFEENMINPIKCIEQRLQLVEEQVQVLVKNSQQSKLPSYTRISAPEFSCGESLSSSLYNEGNENPCREEVGLEKKDTISDEVANLPSCTRISAPEFSCGESMSSSFCSQGNENPFCEEVGCEKAINSDEENNDDDDVAKDGALVPDDDCPLEKPRQALSIDDALAAALVGFMSNTHGFTIKAPVFAMEENDGDDIATKQNENSSIPPISCNESNGTEGKDGAVSSSSNVDIGRDKFVCEAELESAQTDDSQIADSDVVKSSDEITDPISVKDNILDSVSEKTDVELGKGDLENTIKLEEDGNSQETVFVSRKNQILEEYEKRELENSYLDNIIDPPWLTHEVNFELPILDVRFTSEFVTTSSLEALFDHNNQPESVVEASSKEQKLDEKIDPIRNSPLIDYQLLIDCKENDASSGPSKLTGDVLDDSVAYDNQGNFASLL